MKLINKVFSNRKVAMSEVVAQKQSRAAKRIIKKAVLESIQDQARMSKRAKV